MIKRAVVGGGAALLVSGLMFGRDAVSYVSTSAGWVKHSIADNVPVEFEIERAKKMINNLEPEVRRNKQLVVREEVALEQLQEQIDRLSTKQQTDKSHILSLKSEVQGGQAEIVLAGQSYTRDQVTRDLTNRFERFKTNDETLFNLRRVLNARQQSLTAARSELEQMLAKRNQLVAEVAKLEARQTMVTVAQTSNEFNLDDSALARVSQLVRDVETRLDVTERMLSTDIQFAEEIPMDQPESADIASQISTYFNGPDEATNASFAAEVTGDPQL